jgi:hypothetical protein
MRIIGRYGLPQDYIDGHKPERMAFYIKNFLGRAQSIGRHCSVGWPRNSTQSRVETVPNGPRSLGALGV